ncbi:hypothetical protein CYMTET_31119 [Cymbomonas tetramitiformis]|uniref:Strawberry notch helicase C domain-containing protein n=1 Tax=Cymbomonas tetramitiformis TaxID=36881 RepID=A0AAE0FHF0_9CHLO|nr:hypothetical protein CYMTET_31119 [Cymbomonas tetramitiformis]
MLGVDLRRQGDGSGGDGTNNNVASDKLNLKERDDFMQGFKLVAIISEAASTGISLQADKRVANRRRRVHITAELPWSAEKAIQQMGRTHRSNQRSAPEYKLVVTDCAGEWRFAASVAKRLQCLGALRGDRRAASASDLSAYDLDTKMGHKALEAMYAQLAQAERGGAAATMSVLVPAAGASPALRVSYLQLAAALRHMELLGEKAEVKRFLNRLLGLPVVMQSAGMALFQQKLAEVILAAKARGQYDEGVLAVKGSSITAARPAMYLQVGHQENAQMRLHSLKVDRGLSWTMALARLREAQSVAGGSPHNGFWRMRSAWIGSGTQLIALATKVTEYSYLLHRPWGSTTRMSLSDLQAKYCLVRSEIEAEQCWTAFYTASAAHCLHGAKGRDCRLEIDMVVDTGPCVVVVQGVAVCWPARW